MEKSLNFLSFRKGTQNREGLKKSLLPSFLMLEGKKPLDFHVIKREKYNHDETDFPAQAGLK